MAQCKKPVIYVAGNHDHRNFLFTKGINNFLLNVDILAGGVVTKVQNVCILGIGGSPKTEAFWINEWNKDNVFIDPESLRKWNNAKYRILISHCPPINTWLDVDITYARFLGSQWIRQFLTQCKRKPNLFLCGHIHESYNVDFVSETPSINLGSLYLYSRNLFDSQSGRYNTHSTQSLQYWIIDLFPNKVEARNYQSIDFFLDEFILSNAFIIQDGKVLMKKGKAAWHLSVSDDNAPILKESKIIMRRQTTSITPTPGISKMSVKIKDRIKNNEE
jgi:Icc-related predicted phosphoesterase